MARNRLELRISPSFSRLDTARPVVLSTNAVSLAAGFIIRRHSRRIRTGRGFAANPAVAGRASACLRVYQPQNVQIARNRRNAVLQRFITVASTFSDPAGSDVTPAASQQW